MLSQKRKPRGFAFRLSTCDLFMPYLEFQPECSPSPNQPAYRSAETMSAGALNLGNHTRHSASLLDIL
jgi:hypothetical protein